MEKNIKIMIKREEINKRIEEIAKQIDEDYKGEEITAICILNGGAVFGVELILNINSKVKMEFIKISSYEGTESSGKVQKLLDISKEKVEGKNILIIEDIVDTGRSMKYLLENLKEKNPKTLKVCSLLSKPSRRQFEVIIDYLGFEVPNKFVVGYGFDDENGYYRNLPYIGYKVIPEIKD